MTDDSAPLTQVGWRWRARRVCAAHDHPFGPWKMDVSVPDDDGLTVQYQPLYIRGVDSIEVPRFGGDAR